MKTGKRICAILLSAAMLVSYMPAFTYAAAGDGSDTAAVINEEPQAPVVKEDTEEPASTGSDDPAAEGNEEDEEEEPAAAEEADDPGQEAAALKSFSVKTARSVPDADMADSDELLWDYLDREIAEETGAAKKTDAGTRRAAKRSRGSRLSGLDEAIYSELKRQIEYIIAPDENDDSTSTAFRLSLAELLGKDTYTKETIKVADPERENATVDIEAYVVPKEDFEQFYDENGESVIGFDAIINALVLDLPYALYWYDKEKSTGLSLDTKNSYSDDENYYLEADNEPALIFSFCVSADYSMNGKTGTTELDPEKRSRVNMAVSEAAAVIAETSDTDKTDPEILTAYKDAICSRVTYDAYSANDDNEVHYGDPWQMISVFDNDPDTNVVCEGYSKAFQYLCDNTTFNDNSTECRTVTGTMSGGTGQGPHMWNILHMDDGKNYMADITNSDEGSVGADGGLFIAPALTGSVDDGYGYMDADDNGSADITYTYDESTRKNYEDEELTISDTEYGGTGESGEEDSIVPISLNDKKTFTATYDRKYQIYSFTAGSDGLYCFESFGNACSAGYAGSMDEGEFRDHYWDNTSGEGQNFHLYFNAVKGQTVYLKAETVRTPAEGEEVPVEVKVTESSRADSIEISLSEPMSICEHTNGYWNFDNKGNRFWDYYFPGFSDGDSLTVTDGDGSVVYTYENGSFRAEGRHEIRFNSWTSDAWENGEWKVGTHEFVFSYRGAEARCPVEITASPVRTLSFTPAEPLVYAEGIDGYTGTDMWGAEYFCYRYPSFNNGDVLNVNGTDYVFSDESFSFISENGESIDAGDIEWIGPDQYSSPWDIGRHEFELNYMGCFAVYPVEVTENSVKSIEYVPASPYIYYEGIDSIGTETGSGGKEHYLYPLPGIRKGDKLIINGNDEYTASTEMVFTGSDGDQIDFYKIQFSSDQDNGEFWETGSSNYVTIEYCGRTCTIPVSIIAPTDKEISYQPAKGYVLIENVDGEYESDGVAEWFRYGEPEAEDGDVLTVGGKEYTLRKGWYISADGERIDSDEVVFTNDQSADDPWRIDDENEHYAVVSFRGSECRVPVTIAASPVTEISFEPVKPYRFYEHTGGSWAFDEGLYGGGGNDRRWYYYELPEYNDGDRLTVTKGDEEPVVYTYGYDQKSGEGAFLSEDGDIIYGWKVDRNTSQSYEDPWQAGEKYSVTVSYMGATCSVDAGVEENPVESIEYEPAGGHFSITENTNGEQYSDGGIFWYDPPEPQVGDRITLHLASEDDEVYEFTKTQEGAFFISGDGSRLDMQYLYYSPDQWGEWKAGRTYSCKVEYMGRECLADVMITENTVKGFTVALTKTLTIRDSALDEIESDGEDFGPSAQAAGWKVPLDYIDGWDEEGERGPFSTGDQISVTSALGVQMYTLRDNNDYFDDGLGNKIYCSDIEIRMAGSWVPGGDPKLILSYMGRKADPVSVGIRPDPDHVHSLVHHDPVEAGCLTGGYAEFWYCRGCDRYFSDEGGQNVMAREAAVLKAAGHSWGKGTVSKEATCTEKGVMTYTCSVCGETRTQPIPTVGHRWDKGSVTEQSTCSWKGVIRYTCEDCGAEITERLPLAPHNEPVHVAAKAPTCTEGGNVEYWHCNDCGRIFSDAGCTKEITDVYLEPLPHKMTEHPAEEATCSKDGHAAYWTCSECNSLFSDDKGVERIDAPVITEGALGHDWGEWEQTKAPTCTENGEETRTCSRDESHKETRAVNALGHAWGEWERTKDPTCEGKGEESRTCSRDESHKETRAVNALGHDWGEWERTKEPTCEGKGEKARTCSRDSSHKETKEINALGHDWIGEPVYEWSNDKSSVTAKLTCSRDASHELKRTSSTSVVDTATCTEAGTRTYTAKFTDERFETQTLEVPSPALGHDYQKVAGTAVAAGCETAGKHADQKCSRCGDEIEGAVIPATGHDYQNVAGTAVAAGCETAGKHADQKCSRCGDEITGEPIPAEGHKLQKKDAKPAGCTVNGNIEYWKCSTCGKLFRDAEGTAEISEADTVDPAAGHAWGEPVFTFSEGGGSATATRICLTDGSHKETVDASVTSEITRVATADEPGEITYTAVALFDEREYTDTKTVEANTYIPEGISQLSAVGGTHKIMLAWTRSHEVSSETYCIYRREALTDQKKLIKKIKSRETLSYTDEDVVDGKKYTYYVTCMNGYGQESAPSPEATAAAENDTEAPQVVQMKPAENAMIGGKTQITAKATDNVQVTSVMLSVSADGGESWQQVAQNDGSEISYVMDTAGYSSGKILVRAVALDAAGNESEPFSREFTVDNDSPAKVANLTAEAAASSVTLKWDENEEADIKCYRVEQISGDDEIRKIEDVNALGVVIRGLRSSTEYTYQVTAYDILGNRGTPSERVTITTADDDIDPEILSVTPAASFVSGRLEISVKARDNMGLASTVIQYSSDGLEWADLKKTEFDDSPEEATAKGTVNTDDLEEGSLFVRARATDVSGNSNNYIKMEPVEYRIDRTAPAAVTGLSAEEGSGSIALSWQGSEEKDLKGYNVYRSESGGEFTLITKTSSISYTDHTANTPGRTYTYKVAAVDTAGNIGTLSDAVSAEASADTEAPVINTFEPASGSKIGPGKKTFAVLVSDDSALAGMRITYTVDSSEGSDITEEQTLYENDSPDSYYLNVTKDLPVDELGHGDVISLHIYASDTSGNELAEHREITYTVDRTAPEVKGVTATPEDQAVKLQIRGIGAEDLSGYYIYRKEADGKYEYLANVESSGRFSDYDYYDFCEYTDTSVRAGSTYTYMAVAYDACGNTGYRETEEVIIPERVILKADITCDDLIEGGVEYYFSGIKSRSSLGIKEYCYDFGDGSAQVKGEDARVIHRYKKPDEDDADGTDKYTVTLTVTDNGGNTDTITREVTVKRQALVGTVTVTVVDPAGVRLNNVPVYFDMDNTLERVKLTDAKGQVRFVSDAGMYAVGAYTANYLPIRRTMTVNANTDNEMTLTMTEKELVTGNFEVTRLTLDEIRELGIDTSDPESMHYAKIKVTLTYGEVEAVVDRNGLVKKIIEEIGKVNLIPFKPGPEKPPIDWPDGSGGTGFGSGSAGPEGGGNYSSPIPYVAVLEVPVEASFLKEFFDVKLHLISNAASEFTVTDNVVTLDVPEGMTLLDLEQTDGAVVRFDSLSGQETKTIDWCLRGDKEGSYDLTSHYSGKLKNFGADVEGTFTTSEPIKVYGLGAAKVIMEVDPYIQYGAFYTKISLQNVGDADMYLPSIGIVDDMIRATETYVKKQDASDDDKLITDNSVTLLNEYLEDDRGYCQAIPSGGIEVLSKGQMLSRRYACYNAVKTNDLVELQNEYHEIAEGYGIQFEFRVIQHDPYEQGDAETAQAKKDHILGVNGRPTYDWIKDYGNQNFYYYIQSAKSREDFGTALVMQEYRNLSCFLKMDFDLFTNDDKEAVTRRFISEMMRDESFNRQLDDRLEDDYLEISSSIIDWTVSTINSDLSDKNLEELDLSDVKKVLKSAKNMRKLSQAVRNGETETFTDRMYIMIASSGMAASEASLNEIQKVLGSDTTLAGVEDEFKESVTTRVGDLGTFVGNVNTVVSAYNNSSEIYNQMLIMYETKEQTAELLDIILKCDREDIDPAVYDEVKKLRKDLDKKYLAQSEIFTKEFNKLIAQEAAGKVVGKTIDLMDKSFFKGAAGPIGATYAIAGMLFESADYVLGWGTAVESLQNLQIAADLTSAVRKETVSAEEDEDPGYFLTCLKYLIKLRLLGERAYVEAAKQEEEDKGILNMINDDYEADYKDVDEYYLAFKEKLLSYRDTLFRDVEGTVDTPSAPQAGINYAAETTLQTYSDEYEYSFGGNGWKDCKGEAIELSPGPVSRDLRIRKKADGTNPAGSTAYVAVPSRPVIRGDAACRCMRVKGSNSVYIITGIPDGTYYYKLTNSSELDDLGQDAKTLTITDGSAEITDTSDGKAAYIAVRKPAVTSGGDPVFASAVRTIAAEEYKSGDINIVPVEKKADVDDGVAEEFKDEASAVTAAEVGTVLADASMAAAEESDVTAASALQLLKDELAGKEGSGVTNNTRTWDVRIIMQAYLDVKVRNIKTDEEAGSGIRSIELDITPKSRIIASTNEIADKDIEIGKNAVLVEEPKDLDLGRQKTRVRIKLPAAFDNEADIVYVLHNDTEEYAADITSRDKETGEIAIAFDTDGFSPFKVSLESETHIKLGGTGYTSIAAAVKAANDGDTITLEGDVTDAVTVSGKDLTISGGKYDAEIVAGEKTVVTRSGSTKNGDLIIDIHYHVLHRTDAVAATYDAPGNTEYWSCDKCGRYFSDEDGKTEISKGSWMIPKKERPSSDTAPADPHPDTTGLPAAGPSDTGAAEPKTKEGQTVDDHGCSYKVTSVNNKEVTFTKAKNMRKVTVPDTVRINNEAYKVTAIGAKAFTGKKIKNVIIGKNVRKIGAKAFSGSKAVNVTVRTSLLSKSGVKGSLKGSKVKMVIVRVGKKSANKKYVKTYKKIFTKNNAGKKVTVK